MILGGGRRYFALSKLRLRELYQGKTEDEVELRLTLLLRFSRQLVHRLITFRLVDNEFNYSHFIL